MLYELQTDVYPWLRESAGLTQAQLVKVSAVPRSAIQRIEHGKRPPSREEEEAIRQATGCSLRFFAELICRSLSDKLDRPVTIGSGEAIGYRTTTPEAEAHELLRACERRVPANVWLTWKGRLGRIRVLSLWLEQELLAVVTELRTLLRLVDEEDEDGAEAESRG